MNFAGASRPLALVVGELWQRALVARTAKSVALEGIEVQSYAFRFGHDTRPLDYAEILERLLRAAPAGRPLVVVPAAVIAQPGFGKAVERLVRDDLNADSAGISAGPEAAARDLMLFRDADAGVKHAFRNVTRSLAPYVRRLVGEPAVRVARLPAAYQPRQPLRTLEGRETYQALRALSDTPDRWEDEVRILDEAARAALSPGWVYQCNTERVQVPLETAYGCDTVVALGSGIKAWYLANELRRGLRRLVIVDASAEQLRFAHEAFARLHTASTWDDLCDGHGFTAAEDHHFRASHNALFQKIRRERAQWQFDVVFAHCNIVTQTFRFLELLTKLGAVRPLIWYSNVFQPYLLDECSEHHVGLEQSFLALVRERFPEALLFDASPVPSTRYSS